MLNKRARGTLIFGRREESERVSELKDGSVSGRLPYGALGLGINNIPGSRSFDDVRKLDIENERLPPSMDDEIMEERLGEEMVAYDDYEDMPRPERPATMSPGLDMPAAALPASPAEPAAPVLPVPQPALPMASLMYLSTSRSARAT